jgi:hypothetical protein
MLYITVGQLYSSTFSVFSHDPLFIMHFRKETVEDDY